MGIRSCGKFISLLRLRVRQGVLWLFWLWCDALDIVHGAFDTITLVLTLIFRRRFRLPRLNRFNITLKFQRPSFIFHHLDFAPQWTDQKPPLSSARSERADRHQLHAGSNPPTPTHQPSRSRRSNSRQQTRERKRSLSRPHSPMNSGDHDLPPLPTHIGYDLR